MSVEVRTTLLSRHLCLSPITCNRLNINIIVIVMIVVSEYTACGGCGDMGTESSQVWSDTKGVSLRFFSDFVYRFRGRGLGRGWR